MSGARMKSLTSREQSRTVTLYRDDSTTQVVYENVKHLFWLAGNSVLCLAIYRAPDTNEHYYVHWPRERFCWYKDVPVGSPETEERP
jgi:hypothetical protein